MNKKNQQPRLHLVDKNQVAEDKDIFGDEFDDMEQLEILESIREDMEDLGVTTLAEVIERIAALHSKLDNE
jgi:hypothetical protein